jgi:hypothetical protein
MSKFISMRYPFFFFKFTSATAQQGYTDSLKQALSIAKEDATKVNLLFYLSLNYLLLYPDTSTLCAKQALALPQKMDKKFEVGTPAKVGPCKRWERIEVLRGCITEDSNS